MAYDPKRLSVLAYANGFTLWHYLTNDSATAVGTAAERCASTQASGCAAD